MRCVPHKQIRFRSLLGTASSRVCLSTLCGCRCRGASTANAKQHFRGRQWVVQ